jgi:hypothetical protein
MKLIDDCIATIMFIPVMIGIMILCPFIAENAVKYRDEAIQFVEDFNDIYELDQPIYYCNFDTATMIYITDESYDYILESWRYKNDN